MNAELARRAALHSALSDPARLAIVDALTVSDLSPSNLAARLEIRVGRYGADGEAN